MVYDLQEISQDGVICILDDPICAILRPYYVYTFLLSHPMYNKTDKITTLTETPSLTLQNGLNCEPF